MKLFDNRHRTLQATQHTKWFVVLPVVALLIFTTYVYDTVVIGEVVLLVFAVCTVLLRMSSLEVFAIALALFVLMPLAAIVAPESELFDALSVYAFILLCNGLLLGIIEVARKDPDKYVLPGRRRGGKR